MEPTVPPDDRTVDPTGWGGFNDEADHRWCDNAVLDIVRHRLDNPILVELEQAVTHLLEILPDVREGGG